MDTNLEAIPKEWKGLWQWGVTHSKTVRRYRQLSNIELKKRIPAFCDILRELKDDSLWEYGGGVYWKMLMDRFYYFTDRLRGIIVVLSERGELINFSPDSDLFDS